MTFLRQVLVLCLFVLYGIAAVSAAGNGTFSIPSVPNVNVGDNLTATVYLDNTWSPKAADVYMHVRYDSSLLEYTGADFKIGNTVAATKDAQNSIFVQFGDFTNGYPNGRFPIADLKFRATGAGVSPLTVSIDHVRYYVNDMPVDIGDTAAAESGVVTIGAGIMNVTPTIVPLVTVPNTTVPTVNPNITVPTVNPNVTSTLPTPFYQNNYAGSDDYTGVAAGQTTTTAPVTTAPMTPAVTAMVTTTMNGSAGQTPAPSQTMPLNGTTSAITTVTVPASPSAAATTRASTSIPVNTTTTQAAGAGFGLLSLASIGAVALLFIARRLR